MGSEPKAIKLVPKNKNNRFEESGAEADADENIEFNANDFNSTLND